MKTSSRHDFVRACEALDKVYTGVDPVPYLIGMASTASGKIDIFLENGDRWIYNPDTDIITEA